MHRQKVSRRNSAKTTKRFPKMPLLMITQEKKTSINDLNRASIKHKIALALMFSGKIFLNASLKHSIAYHSQHLPLREEFRENF
ncbi:CLUMA_CG006836, isoform A [Clunio marinus]|uniref:CLUMA_CG006836, isoform A n=1 Tax=Clunio marinus TaxID=568069 RepID=A0A1J1HZ38_9DIPT|nr:CLUMA_CG006836, isoform A [Clunio marinus]